MPSGENVYLTMTSADVIHSFWVPPLNGKRDVVPGRGTPITQVRRQASQPVAALPGLAAVLVEYSRAEVGVAVVGRLDHQ